MSRFQVFQSIVGILKPYQRHTKTYLVTLTIDWIESCEVSGRQHQSASYALSIIRCITLFFKRQKVMRCKNTNCMFIIGSFFQKTTKDSTLIFD